MNHLLPGVRLRRRVRELLVRFYDEYQKEDFEKALEMLVAFYRIPRPRVEWYEYIDHGNTLGRTHSDNRLWLIHPEDWKRMRTTPSFQPTGALWVRTLLHEVFHLLYLVEEEQRADRYAGQFVTGL